MVVGRLVGLMSSQGRSLTADYHAAASPQEKARSVLAKLHEVGTPPETIMEIVLAVRSLHREVGPYGWPNWVPMQVSRVLKRLHGVSGTNWQVRGIDLKTRYVRSQGRAMVILGEKVLECVTHAIDHTAIEETLAAVRAGRAP